MRRARPRPTPTRRHLRFRAEESIPGHQRPSRACENPIVRAHIVGVRHQGGARASHRSGQRRVSRQAVPGQERIRPVRRRRPLQQCTAHPPLQTLRQRLRVAPGPRCRTLATGCRTPLGNRRLHSQLRSAPVALRNTLRPTHHVHAQLYQRTMRWPRVVRHVRAASTDRSRLPSHPPTPCRVCKWSARCGDR